eukprot:3200707-Prymnesium_polylepis.1
MGAPTGATVDPEPAAHCPTHACARHVCGRGNVKSIAGRGDGALGEQSSELTGFCQGLDSKLDAIQ